MTCTVHLAPASGGAVSRRRRPIAVTALLAASVLRAGAMAGEAAADTGLTGTLWPSQVPPGCPFAPSPDFDGLVFTGRHSDYKVGDTFYPSWAADGNLYSPWTDGKTDGQSSGSDRGGGAQATTGHAVLRGDDPLALEIRNTSPLKVASALPYRGRYPAGSLVHAGIWYYGTYGLAESGKQQHEGVRWNWPILGPCPGFHISRDLGRTWEPPTTSMEKPLFPEPATHRGAVKMGCPKFVDFGRDMEHSPDGRAYLLGMGALDDDPLPRPGLRMDPETKRPVEIPADPRSPFKNANLSWVTADQIYLARVKPSPETINDLRAYEFYAGTDSSGKPAWTPDFAGIKPLIEWNNHMGCVTATYVPGLKKYLMCVTDGWPTMAAMSSYLLEADTLTGPWRMVTFMKDFGEQAYQLNFPSKFIAPEGTRLWLCYSANYVTNWNGYAVRANPPGSRYGLVLQEVALKRVGQAVRAP